MDDRAVLAQELEPRVLLSSVAKTGSTLRVFGDVGVANTIVVGLDADKKSIIVTVNGATQSVVRDGVKKVRIFGDSQDDRITIDSSAATFNILTSIFGGAGNDRIICGDERDYVEGNDGDDRISLGGGRNFAFGGAGDDVIDGGVQRDFISGGAGADLLTGGDGRDQIQGDNGNDTIDGGIASDLIFGGRGDDLLTGGDAKDVILGGTGNDTLIGGTDRDELFGQEGDDSLDGGGQADTLWGGGGIDILSKVSGSGEAHSGELKDIDLFVRQVIPKIFAD